MGSVPLRYRFVVGLKKWFASIFSWFASAVYWVESAHSCSVTFFECHYDTNDYWGTGCGYLKKIIFASFKNGNICDQMIEFNFWRILLKLIFRSIYRVETFILENFDFSNYQFFDERMLFRSINCIYIFSSKIQIFPILNFFHGSLLFRPNFSRHFSSRIVIFPIFIFRREPDFSVNQLHQDIFPRKFRLPQFSFFGGSLLL